VHGGHTIGNLVYACRACNSSKSNRLLVEWRKSAPIPVPVAWVNVGPACHPDSMTDDEILSGALVDGFELEERACRGEWVHGWRRGDDDRWPCFLTRREAPVGWVIA
jgi:hypothetical protein